VVTVEYFVPERGLEMETIKILASVQPPMITWYNNNQCLKMETTFELVLPTQNILFWKHCLEIKTIERLMSVLPQ
jgi:hypothetical protein